MEGRQLVAWNLRRLRVQQELSQEALAVDAEVDRSYVGRLERAEENPTVGVLDRFAAVLGVHVSELLRKPSPGEQQPKPLKSGRRPRAQIRRSRVSAKRKR
ncbi:helix-turn-helix transcriptional regulator [Bradyrhizobium sp. Pear77]|uniref:helix-turn-helix domain-containing protein n=1 Tax=Bradyrhizobium altum TaxID=1571202 RepID=UPI001E2B9AD8|nr:helix-turn-helix transcriptional regulator [Bradyrhizobium altum]MCC8957737.1 helix-turn-helix transcriptional regulator [Bradyrhizobium altum]